MALPQDFLLQLHDRSEIVELIGSYLELRRRGRIYTGLCPFHSEKTPSFTVYPDTQSFYCFGCGAGGDAITFIKRRENIEYMEAVRLLAERAGLSMPEDVRDDATNSRRRIMEANQLAARFFFDMLNAQAGREARGYLRRRGLSDAMIKRFGLGYAPDAWDTLKSHLNGRGFRNEELVEAGLCTQAKDGKGCFDFFRNRVMFPVFDLRGRVVAFSGRTLGGDTRKYLNTRDTAVFKKSRTLYALNIAKNTDTRRIIIAEGQMDVIAVHQAGFDNAVAALGTALTDEHVRMIGQYADEVVLAYDGDEAGQRATKRAIDALRASRLLIRVLEIKNAKDPDEYIKKFGPDHFKMLIDDSGNSMEYELGRVRRGVDLDTDGGRVQYLTECAAILARASSPTEREVYAGRIAAETGVGREAVLLQVERNRKCEQAARQKKTDRQFVRGAFEKYDTVGRGAQIGAVAAERRLIALLFRNPDLCDELRARLEPEDFSSSEMAGIYRVLAESIQGERFSGMASLSQELEAGQIAVLSGILAENAGVNFGPEDADFITEKILQPHSMLSADDIKLAGAEELMKKLAEKKN